jgi:catechol 2,3-dioxygenase-like lactoylglutathione lyase family enzyme
MSKLNAINHIAFFCRNQVAQEAFYARIFGFKRSRTFKRGEPGEFFLLKLGTTRLEFFSAKPGTAADAAGGEQPVGFRHLAFDVPKIEPVLEALKAEGIAHDPIMAVPHIDPGCRIVFFRDPEGNIIELMENYRDEE